MSGLKMGDVDKNSRGSAWEIRKEAGWANGEEGLMIVWVVNGLFWRFGRSLNEMSLLWNEALDKIIITS